MKSGRRTIKGIMALFAVLSLISCGGSGGGGDGLDSSSTSIGGETNISSDASASSNTTSTSTDTTSTGTATSTSDTTSRRPRIFSWRTTTSDTSSSGTTTTSDTSGSGTTSSDTTTTSDTSSSGTTSSGTTGGIPEGTIPPAASGGTYDDRVGLGSDSNGIPTLTKDANARYIYWNPAHANASDANAGTDPAHPKATLSGAWNALRNGYGDWLLMAKGASASGLVASSRSGLSAQYPIVVTTYDPADPTNTSAMRQGLATIDGLALYDSAGKYIVFENMALSDTLVITIQNTSPRDLYVMFHNVQVKYAQATLQSDAYNTSVTNAVNDVIFRHCVFAYSPGQGMYMWGTGDVTVEDSIFYHNGWVNSRSEANMFDHNAYFGTNTFGTVFRRNVSGHASSHGLQLRGGGYASDNVFASNPVNVIIGGGDEYNTYRPNGVPYDVRNNVIVGSEDINSSNPRGFGVGFENTQDGGTFDNNLIVNIGNQSTANRRGFVSNWISTEYNVPTYINLTNNIFWNWKNEETLAAELTTNRRYPNQLHFAYSGNVIEFDASPSGTNRNAPQTAFPDPTRNLASYASANGYSNEGALWEAMMANPKAAWAKSIGDYIRAGYGR